jgi:hypothetical protein
LRAHLPARLRLPDPEGSALAEIGKRLGRKALVQVACVAKPDTILAWLYGQESRRIPFQLAGIWTEFLRATTLRGFGDYRDPQS